MGKDILIFLTGTVDPKGMTFTKLQDTNIRKQQYLETLQKWLKKQSYPILLVENSNFDMQFFKDNIPNKFHHRLELLSYEGNDFPRHLGKGYGEMQLIKYAVENSDFLRKADFVFKVSGRYFIKNFNTCLQEVNQKPETDLYLNFKEFLKYADSRFFGCKSLFFEDYLLKFAEMVNDSKNIFFENILAKATLRAISEDYFYLPLNSYPLIEGVYGTVNKKYKTSFLFWLPRNIKMKIKMYMIK